MPHVERAEGPHHLRTEAIAGATMRGPGFSAMFWSGRCLVWMLYYSKSERVRATFVR